MSLSQKTVRRCVYVPLGVILTGVLLSGCATSAPTHSPGLVTSWNKQTPLPLTAAPPISLILHVRYTASDDRPGSVWFQQHISEPMIRRYLNKTMPHFPCLAKAQVGNHNAPYRLVIDATHAIHSNKFRTFLATISLFLIPDQMETALELDAKMYRSDTLLKTYQARGSYQYTFHLFFLPISGRRFSVPDTAKEDTFWDLFLQIQHDAPMLFQPTESHRT